MTHFGLLCPPSPGHLNPSLILGETLRDRGHRVTLFTAADLVPKLADVGVEVWGVGRDRYPPGSLEASLQRLGQLSRLEGVRYSVQILADHNQTYLDELPELAGHLGIEAWIVDQVSLAGNAVAEYLGQPHVTVCNALPIDREPSIPPPFTPWGYSTAPWAQVRNRLANGFIDRLVSPIGDRVMQQRRLWNLPPLKSRRDFYSPLLWLRQLPPGFDFPRRELLPWVHDVGPLQRRDRGEPLGADLPPFPFERLDGRPLIYGSLGTLQNQIPAIFQMIADGCADLPVQLVLSLGRADAQVAGLRLPPGAIAVPYAPQQQLIDRAQLVVTHAGMNATLSALSVGVPLVAVPITNEQPGIAARIAHHGVGVRLPLKSLTVEGLRRAIATTLENPSYRDRARQFQHIIQGAGGVERAADLIEQAIATRQPVMRP